MATSSRRSGSTSPPTTQVPPFAGSWWFPRMNHHVTVRQIPRRRDRSRETPIVRSNVRKSNAARSLPVLETFVSSSKKRGYRRSTAPRPTWVLPWCASSKPNVHLRRKQPWPTFGSPRPWWRKRARQPSPSHLRQAAIRAVDLIDLRAATSLPSRRRSIKTTPSNLGRTVPRMAISSVVPTQCWCTDQVLTAAFCFRNLK
jgi:hypothetical protein